MKQSGTTVIQTPATEAINPAKEDGNLASIKSDTGFLVSIKVPVDVQDHWVEAVTISASSAKTTSGNTADIDVGKFLHAEVCLDVTAASGTSQTLTFYLEGKDPVSGKYKTLWDPGTITAVGTFWLAITTLAFKYLRARWVIGGGTPSFTFSVGMSAKS